MENILFELTIGFFLKLVDLSEILLDFLFSEIEIGDWTFSLWELAGGGLMVTLLIAWLIKKLVPVA